MGKSKRLLIFLTRLQHMFGKVAKSSTKRSFTELKVNFFLKRDDSCVEDEQACFREAIEIAHKQSAKSWELRATISLARLLQKQNLCAEARTTLAPSYNWFTEGFDTADLKDAKTLLNELDTSP